MSNASNNDGAVDLGDAIHTGCPDAADTNDDGAVTVTDGIREVAWLFLGGDEPAAPGPTHCGTDPTSDALPVPSGGQSVCRK